MGSHFREFHDPRLVALYDEWGRDRSDAPFYLELAEELSASLILDIGCGAGQIASQLATRGHQVWGVDPAAEMLRVARSRPGSELVRWIEGDASAVVGAEADLAIMTGHVAQVISDDDAWDRTLRDVHAALRPGGHLAFESRNPQAREWLLWTPQHTFQRWEHTAAGVVEAWWQLTEVRDPIVRTQIHYRFLDVGDEAISTSELRFRDEDELASSLTRAGFTVREVFGDWDRAQVAPTSPELIFLAVRS